MKRAGSVLVEVAFATLGVAALFTGIRLAFAANRLAFAANDIPPKAPRVYYSVTTTGTGATSTLTVADAVGTFNGCPKLINDDSSNDVYFSLTGATPSSSTGLLKHGESWGECVAITGQITLKAAGGTPSVRTWVIARGD